MMSILERVWGVDLGDWIAIAALLLSLTSIWLQYGVRARADLIVRHEMRRLPNGSREDSVVIYNAGASDARDVKLKLTDGEHELSPSQLGFKEDTVVPVIAAGHEFSTILLTHWSQAPMLESTVMWRDRRPLKEHTRVSTMSII